MKLSSIPKSRNWDKNDVNSAAGILSGVNVIQRKKKKKILFRKWYRDAAIKDTGLLYEIYEKCNTAL